MNQIQSTSRVALASLLLLSLTACDQADTRSAGQKLDTAIARTDAAAEKAGKQASAAIGDIGPAARNAAQASRTVGATAAAEVKEAGAKAAVVTTQAAEAAGVAARKIAHQLDDVTIAAKVTTGLAADKNLSALKIRVDSRDGAVTLKGPAPTAAARARAEEIARNVKGVTSVNNQLTVG